MIDLCKRFHRILLTVAIIQIGIDDLNRAKKSEKQTFKNNGGNKQYTMEMN